MLQLVNPPGRSVARLKIVACLYRGIVAKSYSYIGLGEKEALATHSNDSNIDANYAV